MKYIQTFEEFVNESLYEALTPEERREKRKARRIAKKQQLKSSGNSNFDADIEDIDSMEAEPSKSMTQSVERYREEMIKLQDLQKEFVLTPKDNIAKRESLKKKLIIQSKIAKKAEADFERTVADEDGEADELFF